MITNGKITVLTWCWIKGCQVNKTLPIKTDLCAPAFYGNKHFTKVVDLDFFGIFFFVNVSFLTLKKLIFCLFLQVKGPPLLIIKTFKSLNAYDQIYVLV